jgi:hypothetical protein
MGRHLRGWRNGLPIRTRHLPALLYACLLMVVASPFFRLQAQADFTRINGTVDQPVSMPSSTSTLGQVDLAASAEMLERLATVDAPIGQTVPRSNTDCSNGPVQANTHRGITFIEANGTSHPTSAVQVLEVNICNDQPNKSVITGGYALDATGYYVGDDGTGNPLVRDNNGIEVYPKQMDRFGNYRSSGTNENLIGHLDSSPTMITTIGNKIPYSVLTFGASRVAYVATISPITVATQLKQPGTYNLTSIQRVTLPDGSSYSFAYEDGSTTILSLPSGSVVEFGQKLFRFLPDCEPLADVVLDRLRLAYFPHHRL